MSNIENLGLRVRSIIADLPSGDTGRAVRHLESAHRGLTRALRDSVTDAGAVNLAAAREHLHRVALHLRGAGDRLDDYLTAIGVPPVNESTTPSTTTVPGPESARRDRHDWWRSRINHISDGDATADPGQSSVTTLFSELVELAGSGDRDAYRKKLLAAGPVTGVKLSGLSWPMIRTLSTDILGRTPGETDHERLAQQMSEPVDRLLPKLPDGVMLGQLRGANNLLRDHRSPADGPHPADVAAVGPILVAALLRVRDRTGKER